MSVILTPSHEIENPNLIGCDKEVEAVGRVLERVVDKRTAEYLLCFGMPGCGKSSFADQVAYSVNQSASLGCSVLHFQCNETALWSDIEGIEMDFHLISTYVEQKCPLILSFDELDCIAQDRLKECHDPRYIRLSLKVTGLLSGKFIDSAGRSGGLIVLLTTNTPLLLEASVLDRTLGGIVYFPPPNKDTSLKILKHFIIQEPDLVYDILTKKTSGAYFTGRALVEACRRTCTVSEIATQSDAKEIAEAIYSYFPPLFIDQQYLENYRITHSRLIAQSKAFLERP